MKNSTAGLLAEYLSPSRFQIPTEECPVHSEYCSHFQVIILNGAVDVILKR